MRSGKTPLLPRYRKDAFGWGRFDGCILQNGVLLKDGNSIFICENFDVTARNARSREVPFYLLNYLVGPELWYAQATKDKV